MINCYSKKTKVEDVTNKNILNLEEMDRVRLGIASGEIKDYHEVTEQYGPISMYDSGIEHGHYRITIEHYDSNTDYGDLSTFQFFVIVTYENGERKMIFQC
ncbi:hypothetical protein [Lachnoclostridium phytofermentans]|uniref:Uncharacterized protein n=1 Tax=Lachnoclostridium phytofermentans (strain ATCC 700394 / DSM 18823 / ISDg) TaxID=357809 RepID=A9KHS2_LACP7|nr:hypothetical protein [Lachnoclostridium phytofermentans]ABX42357.1 hypothetical protein Cphy_1989 [Lachnoclostridium phytofermentans ISDg]